MAKQLQGRDDNYKGATGQVRLCQVARNSM